MRVFSSSSPFSTAAQVLDKIRSAAIDPRIERALELLNEPRAGRIGDIPSILNLSHSRFRHLFRKELGISPAHYVRLIQMERARQLLLNSFLSVKEIAGVVGINDISHFVRDYKALYGQTPSQTRAAAPGANARML